MEHKRTTSLDAQMFVCAVCFIIVGLVAWSTLRERESTLSQSTAALANMAMALAQHADQTFNEADMVLVGLQETLRHDGYTPKTLERLHDMMVMRVKELDQLNGLFLYDEKGRWTVNSQAVLSTSFNNADRDYFIYHRDHAGDKPFIGKPIQSRSSGQWILTVSRRIDKPDGSFGGVLLATLNLSFFERFYNGFNLGERGAILLGDLNGTAFLRRPRLDGLIGKQFDGQPLFEHQVRVNKQGSMDVNSPLDGIERIVSYHHLTDNPLYIVVSLSKDEVLAAWRDQIAYRVLFVSMIIVFLAYGGRRLVGQIELRETAEEDALRAQRRMEEINVVLAQQALRDGLTGLANRRRFDEALKHEIALVGRNRKPLTLVLLDVDLFKPFNDRYGHVAGDECLQRIGEVLMSIGEREADLACRYGGEEFALILPDCDQTGAQLAAQRIRQRLNDLHLAHEASPRGIITVSMGMVTLSWPIGAHSQPQDVIKAADSALYASKVNGRDRATAMQIENETANI